MDKKILRREVGILLCGQFRDFLEFKKLEGLDIEWLEGRGWLSRVFSVKGNADDLRRIKRVIDKFDE